MSLEMNTYDPCTGDMRAKLRAFLAEEGLGYDENITHTLILSELGEIVASGSCHGNVLKCIAVSKAHQGQGHMATLMTHLVEHLVTQGIGHYFVFTKPKNLQMFRDMGMYAVIQTDDVLLLENRRAGLDKYVATLQKRAQNHPLSANATRIGAIVANCNPFTLGHRYLMEQACAQCDLLHLFVLSTDGQRFTAKQRWDMVQQGVADIPNILVHPTSDYMISPAVFPTYFIKDQVKAVQANCMVDLRIFCEKIAPALGITHRFVGTEPTCQVTSAYNAQMQQVLPTYGIGCTVIARLEQAGQAISASVVRKALTEQDWQTLETLLPATSLQYLQMLTQEESHENSRL